MSDTDTTLDTTGIGNTISNPRNSRSRHWSITINNYTSTDVEYIKSLSTDHEITWQEEIGKEGTPHIQAGISFKNARYFNSIKKMFPNAHIEEARNINALIKYCNKPETRNGESFTNHKIKEKKIKNIYDHIYEKILKENPYSKNFEHYAQLTDGCQDIERILKQQP